MKAAEVVRALGMSPHPEGGHFVETYRDVPADGSRGAATCISFLLAAGELSAWHRIDVAEIWHYQAGAPLVLTLSSNGHDAESHRIGPDIARGERGHVVVPPGCWQTAESLGAWTLASCTVAPAFDFAGFEMAPPGWRPTPRPR